jgi:hypothetical protein
MGWMVLGLSQIKGIAQPVPLYFLQAPQHFAFNWEVPLFISAPIAVDRAGALTTA